MAQATPEDTWLTMKQIQQLLSLSRGKAYEIVASEEEIETVQLGRTLRVNKASLDRWVPQATLPEVATRHTPHRSQLNDV